MSAEQHRWFQVSGRGNGVGLTVLRTETAPNSGVFATFIFHILPKLWRSESVSRTYILDSDISEESHYFLFETDKLGVDNPQLVSLLETLVTTSDSTDDNGSNSEVEKGETSEEAESRLSTLWSIVAPPKNHVSALKPIRLDSGSKPVALWKMLDAYKVEIEPNPTSKDFGSAGAAIFAKNPVMRGFVYQRFVQETLEALRDRRPSYVIRTETLGVVRGRIVPEGLMRRQITRSPKIECEFEELTTDNHIWQVIREAVEICVPGLKAYETSYKKAMLAAAQLRDVSVASKQALLAEAASFTLSRQEAPAVAKSYRMALAILRQVFNAAVDDGVGPGVIANLKYAMNGIWEQLVQGYFNQQAGMLAFSQYDVKKVNVFYERANSTWGKALDGGKRPDVLVRCIGEEQPNQQDFYIDAKYKVGSLGITNAGMSDQYQMATYALRTRRNVYLAYPRCSNDGFIWESSFQYIPYGDTPYQDGKSPTTRVAVRVGQFFLPFPTAEQAAQGIYLPETPKFTVTQFAGLADTEGV